MKRYKLFIRGSGLRIFIDDELAEMGFYTTRFVTAANAKEAGREAVRQLALEERTQPAPGNPAPRLLVEEVTEIEPNEVPAVKPGLAFYHEDEDLEATGGAA